MSVSTAVSAYAHTFGEGLCVSELLGAGDNFKSRRLKGCNIGFRHSKSLSLWRGDNSLRSPAVMCVSLKFGSIKITREAGSRALLSVDN